ncbi:hypothetical protein KQI63_11195 [bacterium]|nr:hypothetical protein [bacterium]
MIIGAKGVEPFERFGGWLLACLILLAAMPHPFPAARPHFLVLTLFTIGTLLFALLYMVEKQKRPVELPALPMLAFLLMMLGMMLGLLHAGRPMTALLTFSYHLTFGGLVILSAVFLQRSASGWQLVARGASLALLLHGAVGLGQVIAHPGSIVEGVLAHGNVFAMMLVLLLPWTVWVLREDRSPWWRRLALVAIILAVITLPFTRSAGAALALAIGWGGAALLRWKGAGAATKTGLVFLSALLAGGTLVWLLADGQVAVSTRMDNIHVGWTLFAHAPFSGQGPGQFLFLYPALRSPMMDEYTAVTAQHPLDHVHLEPLHTLVEGGVFAGVGLVLLFGVAMVYVFRLMRRDDSFQAVIIWAAFIALLVQGTVSLAPTRQVMLPAALALGAVLAFAEPRRTAPLKKSLLLMLFVGLIALLPLQFQRLKADRQYALGRDWHQYFAAEDPSQLREALASWPEELESRSLLLVNLYREAAAAPEANRERTDLLMRALAQADTLDMLSPQYFKTPVLRARILLRLGLPGQALEALERGDRFVKSREYRQLQEIANIRNQNQ